MRFLLLVVMCVFSILVVGVFFSVVVKVRWVWVCMVWLLVVRLVGRLLIRVFVLFMLLICSRVRVRLSFSLFLFGLVVICVCSILICVCGFSGVLFLGIVLFILVGMMLCWVRNLCSWFFGMVFGKLFISWLFLIRNMVGIEWIWKVVVICCFLLILILVSLNVLLYLVVSFFSIGLRVLYGLY